MSQTNVSVFIAILLCFRSFQRVAVVDCIQRGMIIFLKFCSLFSSTLIQTFFFLFHYGIVSFIISQVYRRCVIIRQQVSEQYFIVAVNICKRSDEQADNIFFRCYDLREFCSFGHFCCCTEIDLLNLL